MATVKVTKKAASKKPVAKKAASKKPVAKKAASKKPVAKKAAPVKATPQHKGQNGGRPLAYSKGEVVKLTTKGRSIAKMDQPPLGCRNVGFDCIRWTIRKAFIEGAQHKMVQTYQGHFEYEGDPAKHGKGKDIKVPCSLVSFVNWFVALHCDSRRVKLANGFDIKKLAELELITITAVTPK